MKLSWFLVASLALSLGGSVSAVAISWYLRNVWFENGSTVTGSFEYDETSNTYSNIAITTETATYHDLNPTNPPDATGFFLLPNSSLPNLRDQPVLGLEFIPALSSSEGNANIKVGATTQSFEGTCATNNCGAISPQRYVSSNSAYVTTDATATTWQEITFDDFESGWGNFNKRPGSDDAARVDKLIDGTESPYIPVGNVALRIRDDNNHRSSVFLDSDYDVTGCSSLRVRWWYYPRSMESAESFVLNYSPDGGSNWTVVKCLESGLDFVSDVKKENEIVEMDASDYEFTTQARIRFRCDASDDDDYIYLDQVSFECLPAVPTEAPTMIPTRLPTGSPTVEQTAMPTSAPTTAPPTPAPALATSPPTLIPALVPCPCFNNSVIDLNVTVLESPDCINQLDLIQLNGNRPGDGEWAAAAGILDGNTGQTGCGHFDDANGFDNYRVDILDNEVESCQAILLKSVMFFQ